MNIYCLKKFPNKISIQRVRCHFCYLRFKFFNSSLLLAEMALRFILTDLFYIINKDCAPTLFICK